MSDAFRIWRDAEGKSVVKTIRTIWPDLAKALDEGAGLGQSSEKRRAERPDCQVRGNHCNGKAAGKLIKSGRLACIPCWGGHSEFVRNPEWTLQRNPRKVDPRKRWEDS